MSIMSAKIKVLTHNGCGVCSSAKKKGMCKKLECVPISSKEGKKIAKKLNASYVPMVVKIEGGKIKKGSQNTIKKFLK